MITGISSWVRPFIAEAGIAKMSFSKFFPSKGDLHLAVIRNAHDAIMTSHIELSAEAPALSNSSPRRPKEPHRSDSVGCLLPRSLSD